LLVEPTDLRDPETALRMAEELNEQTGFENAGFLDIHEQALVKGSNRIRYSVIVAPRGFYGLGFCRIRW
jgi:hypothetical protein